MSKINVYEVKPLSSKKENLLLLIAFLLIIVVASIILRIRYKPVYVQNIDRYEISSYRDFNSIESGVYSDLKNSLTDISIIYKDEGQYPDIKYLEEEQIPPYYKDIIWEKRGSIEWSFLKHDNDKLYLGLSNNTKEVGNFLIKINEEDIENSDIYYFKEKYPKKEILEKLDDYKEIFKKIVPYTGTDERKKFKGE